ncbi:Na(+)/H(+) antiporter subunit D [Pseudomarimonas arenosa]|uniref:Na(+)/H(+) antiporter subunit D n=1 Tax=Pseudomarimonas arenosa TaxID=2774145 RepID=A0AAW3ZJ20_9GAMM|nr:Na(+)/H(+) antiporter subunit D [Pseudomarimonas arenosa]MBD8525147.1 Na(+)/H(+) antiporter subunit D [Pseudomarimonas arenosa]
MIEAFAHPGLMLIFGGLMLALNRSLLRDALALVIPVFALWMIWQLPEGTLWRFDYLGLRVEPLRVDSLSRLFATVFTLMAAVGALFALRQPSRLELPAAFVYAGSAVGAVLAGDLFSLFIAWEMMAIGSTLVLWSQPGEAARRATQRYLMMHLLGGVLLLAGIAGHVQDTGNIAFVSMSLDSVSHWLILAGFLINAGAPPFSAWLPDAYPEATYSGTVFLSAFTTKTAVYVLMRGFAGEELLIYIGLFMVFYGVVYALLENDMRRVLAYSIVNQVGFMVAAIGVGTPMALNGAAALAFVHIVYKGLLLMSAGAVLHAVARRNLSDLGGLFHSMPRTAAFGLIGALASLAAPLTSGFVSKSMVLQAAAEQHLVWVWMLLVAASAGVVLHSGLKFPWFVFFHKDSGLRPSEAPWHMQGAMAILAILCIGIGVYPDPLYDMLPHPVEYLPYTAAHLLTQTQLLLISALAFFLLLPWLQRSQTITLDTDWLYRRLAPAGLAAAGRAYRAAAQPAERVTRRLRQWVGDIVVQHHLPSGRMAQTWPTGYMALWMLLLMLGCLVLYFWQID